MTADAMTPLRLLLQSLGYHWRTNLAVLLGCAVGASVLTGALLVGDSMRGSLRAMTLERLGAIDLAAISGRFFRQDLPARLSADEKFADSFSRVAAVVLIRGTVAGPDDRHATDVQLVGTTPEFWELFPSIEPAQDMATRVVANRKLADALDIDAGARVIAMIEKESSVPKEGLLGNRAETTRNAPFVVDQVIETHGVGRFGLDATQRLPKTLFVPIADLAKAIEQPGRANALFLTAKSAGDAEVAEAGEKLLGRVMSLDDYGLLLKQPAPTAQDEDASDAKPASFGIVLVESRRQILDDPLADAIGAASDAMKACKQPVMTYLANTIADGKKEVPYSIVTALGDSEDCGRLPTEPADLRLGKNEILLNRWTVDRLEAKPGDAIRLDYYVVDERGGTETRSHEFRLAGVVKMEGVALDRSFTPDYPGISDAEDFGDWNPPFPFDLNRVKPSDEKYWDDYRTAPKAFVRLDDGQALWETRFGKLTSIRLTPPAGIELDTFAGSFGAKLLATLNPGSAGLALMPLKSQDLAASSGSTDFGQLFLAFSFFLIVSAGLLVGLLFRLNAERRASQFGLLLAVGIATRTVRRLLLGEGLILAGIGSLAGLLGARWYARAMIDALTNWWQAAVGTPFIEYHSTWFSFAIGWISSVVVAMLAIRWAVARLGVVPVPRLLSPGFTFASTPRSQGTRWSRVVAVVGLLGGVASVASAPLIGSFGAFFGGGALLLVGGLGALSARLRALGGKSLTGSGWSAGATLGVRNGGRYPARSVLTAGLLAFASFVVVAVGALRHGEQDATARKDSGNGGFSLVATSTVPLYKSLSETDGRFDLNLSDEADKLLEECEIFQFPVRSGDDASCLNVFQPRDPTLLGAGDGFIERGGFAFASSLAETDAERTNPWLLLKKTFPDGAIPAISDWNTQQYILKVKVGQDLTIRNSAGQEVTLRMVAGLSNSVFQGELLIDEKRLQQAFPEVAGDRFFLFETPPEKTDAISTLLTVDLVDYGIDVQTTWARIAAFKAVQNTYMGAFQTLGGLGLLLGTLGLGTVLFRNVLERRGELGLLRALGFRKALLGWIVLAENLFLLFAGLGIGTVCALVAVLPELLRLPDYSGLASLVVILVFVLFAGMLSGLFAVVAALRTPLLTALRTE